MGKLRRVGRAHKGTKLKLEGQDCSKPGRTRDMITIDDPLNIQDLVKSRMHQYSKAS